MQRVSITVVCGATHKRIVTQLDGSLKFYTTVKPIRGAANQAIIKMAAEYFNVPASKVRIRLGHTSHKKLLEIG